MSLGAAHGPISLSGPFIPTIPFHFTIIESINFYFFLSCLVEFYNNVLVYLIVIPAV